MISLEPLSPAQKHREARQWIEHATAIIDGEVVRPLTRDRPALVRVQRVLKGPDRLFVEVGTTNDSCDIELDRTGERLRMILQGGTDLYYLRVDSADSRYVDKILRSDRRKVWPYRQGETPLPTDGRR